MTESQFADAITQSAISSNYKINDTADNDIGFEIFNCVVSALVMTCDKFQMRPASSYSGGFRFESGYLAKGLTFDSAKASTKWIDQIVTLEGGSQLVISAAMALLVFLVQ